MLAMSGSQFMEFFKRATGMTFVAYPTHVRLNKACRLLTETDASIAKVASSVVFSDQSYFDERVKREGRKANTKNPLRRLCALCVSAVNETSRGPARFA